MKSLTIILAAMLTPAFAEDDGKLTIEVPSSVQAVISKEKGEAGKITSFKKVNETDGTTFLVELLIDGKAYELSLDAAGRVMRKGRVADDGGPRVMKIEAVPVKVRTTLQREAGAGVIEEVEMQEQKTNYVTEVKIGRRKYRIVVDAEGVLVSKEYTGDDEEN
jgi:hypothetical protein